MTSTEINITRDDILARARDMVPVLQERARDAELARRIPAETDEEFRKAGFSGWWSLIIFVPLVNIAMIWVFAFVDWPAAASKEKVAGVFD